MNIKEIPTETLIEELESRKNIKKIAVGPYQNYRLETKYEPDGAKKISGTVLLINPQNETIEFQEYLNSVLDPDKVQQLKEALDCGKTIIVAGKQGPTGKSVLTDVLNQKGYHAIEGFHTYTVELNKPIENMIPNFKDKVI